MLNATSQADVYTSFDGLAKLKNDARNNSPEALKQTAKQFEAIFINNVLKAMREAKLADGAFDNNESKFFTEMYHHQLAEQLSGSVGLADLIVKQLGGQQANAAKGQDGQNLAEYFDSAVPVNALPPSVRQEFATRLGVQGNASDEEVLQALFNGSSQNRVLPSDSGAPIQSPGEFVQRLRPYAEQAAQELGVEPDILLAQAALETGWGQSLIKNNNGSTSYNLFNIKADRAWQGRQAQVPTLEYEGGVVKKVNAGFRSYGSFQESFQDYVRFIKNNPRYENALRHADNPRQYVHELQRAGYATDPKYAGKVLDIYHGGTLAASRSGVQVAANG
ncbi:MAG: flagellar assembly peptidoglycan hydrolase FlgJ [Methylomonas sp.]|nr:MAG: flagellar assembly peptidoglycan hydrolase FlgJ [Methylomonas sp.]